MKLSDYVDRKNLKAIDIAYDLKVSEAIVKRWLKNDFSPRLVHAIKLNELTKGKVKFKDMLSWNDTKLLEE